jgi:hypothetical protein
MRWPVAFILFILSSTGWAQLDQPQLIDQMINVLTREEILSSDREDNLFLIGLTSELEDLIDAQMYQPNDCHEQNLVEKNCLGLVSENLPESKRDYRVLFEVKYNNPQVRPTYQPGLAGRNFSKALTLSRYFAPTGEFDYDQLDELAQKIFETKPDSETYQDISKTDIKTALFLDHLLDERHYLNETEDASQKMLNLIKDHSYGLSDDEFLHFLSAVAGWVEYNDDRADFKQTESAGLGRISVFDLVSGNRQGICGDIHSVVAKLAEARGYEAFTVGYGLDESNHVVTAVVDPNNPDKISIINYGRYEQQALNDGNSAILTPTSSYQELGMQLRIFKNDSPGQDGRMQQIATIPTALGSFMSDLFLKDHQISKAMPANQNFNRESVTLETSKESLKVNEKKNKMMEREATQGLIIYEGQTDNAQIFGVAVSHDVYKNIYRYDKDQNKCVPKKSKYFSVGLAGSILDLPQAGFNQVLYAYLNLKGGQIIRLIETEYIQLKGLLGYELDGFVGFNQGQFFAGDAHFASFAGLMLEYQKKNTSIQTVLKYEGQAALRDQNLMTDYSTLSSNVRPMAFNALSLQANWQQKLNPYTSLFSHNEVMTSRVGSRVLLSAGIMHNNSSVSVSYQGGARALPIGNSLQHVSLLRNFNQMDGVRLHFAQDFSSRNNKIHGNFNIWGGVSTSTPSPLPMAGGTLRVNLFSPRKK